MRFHSENLLATPKEGGWITLHLTILLSASAASVIKHCKPAATAEAHGTLEGLVNRIASRNWARAGLALVS